MIKELISKLILTNVFFSGIDVFLAYRLVSSFRFEQIFISRNRIHPLFFQTMASMKKMQKKHIFTSNSLSTFCPRPEKSTNTFQGLRNTISLISSHAKFRPRHKAAVAIRALVELWVFRKEWIGKIFDRFDTQMLHVRNIYLHLAQIYCKCRYIFHTWNIWDSWWFDSDT